MTENITTDTMQDDDLEDEALDRTSEGRFTQGPACGATISPR